MKFVKRPMSTLKCSETFRDNLNKEIFLSGFVINATQITDEQVEKLPTFAKYHLPDLGIVTLEIDNNIKGFTVEKCQ